MDQTKESSYRDILIAINVILLQQSPYEANKINPK
jgi:hypothetical protein